MTYNLENHVVMSEQKAQMLKNVISNLFSKTLHRIQVRLIGR